MRALPLILIVFVGLFFTSCVTLYKPNAINSPMLDEKGQGNASASFSVTGSGLANAQLSYAVSNHIGIMASGMYHYRSYNYSSSSSSGNELLNMYFADFGLGYFSRDSSLGNLLFQVYGGVGLGDSEDRLDHSYGDDPLITAQFRNVFIQPGIVFKWDKIEMGIDVKGNLVQVYDIYSNDYDQFNWWEDNSEIRNDTTLNFVLLEPTFTFRGGGNRLKGVAQVGLTLPVVNTEAYFAVNSFAPFITPLFKFSLGFNYTFGKKTVKKKL